MFSEQLGMTTSDLITVTLCPYNDLANCFSNLRHVFQGSKLKLERFPLTRKLEFECLLFLFRFRLITINAVPFLGSIKTVWQTNLRDGLIFLRSEPDTRRKLLVISCQGDTRAVKSPYIDCQTRKNQPLGSHSRSQSPRFFWSRGQRNEELW